MNQQLRKHISWIIFVLITIFSGLFFFVYPTLGEAIYGGIIYPFFRLFLDRVADFFDQSIAWAFIIISLFILIQSIIKKGFIKGVKFLFFLIVLFYWLWGFNYYRTPLVDNDKLDIEFSNVDDSTHLALTMRTLESCIELSDSFDKGENTDYDNSLLKSCIQLAEQYPFLYKSKVKPVPVHPEGIFLRMGILGMYFPYTGQAQYEIKLGPIDRPFTIAHEWCHAAGVAPEHEADFLAYIICMSNENESVRYSAQMHLLYELLFYYKIRDKDTFENMISLFTPTMQKHIHDRKERYEEYSGPISEMSDEMIDRYLKLQNQEGIGDYHRLSEYVFAWKSEI